jgi:hypothetical protein
MTPIEKVAAWNERLKSTEFSVALAGDLYSLRLRGTEVGLMTASNIEKSVEAQTC